LFTPPHLQAIAKNRNSALTSIDWSNNLIKDAGVAALGTPHDNNNNKIW
jgi:hypothetical protein